jgi:hypothetical protein
MDRPASEFHLMTATPVDHPGALTGEPFDRRLFMSGMLSFLLAGALAALYGLSLPVWSRAFGLGPGEGGLLLSAHGAGALATVAAGVAGLPVVALRTGLGLLAAGTAALALAPAWGIALVGAMLSGTGFGMVVQVVNRRFLTGFGSRGAAMVGLVNATFGAGAILAPFAVILSDGQPEPVLTAVAALLVLALFAAPSEPSQAGEARGLPPLRDPRLLLLLPILVAVAMEGAFTGFGAAALIDRGLSDTEAASLVSGFFTAYLAGRLSLWKIAALVPPGALFLVGLGGTALMAGLAAIGAPGWGFVAAGAFVGITWPSFYVWSTRLLGSDPRMGSAVLGASILGSTLGAFALRPVLGVTGEGAVFAVVAVIAGILAMVLVLLGPTLRRLPAR